MNDLRQAWRRLTLRPGFAVAVVLTLALGIGGTTAIFSVFHAVILKPLPYPHPEQLVAIWESRPAEHVTHNVVSSGNYLDWRDNAGVFSSMGAYSGTLPIALAGAGRAELVASVTATPSVLATLGVVPQIGHGFTRAGSADEVLISHGLWQRRFGGDPAVVGRTIEIEESSVQIAGVLPASFAFPDPDVEVWIPHLFDASDREARDGHKWRVVARLEPDVTVQQAREQMDILADAIREHHPKHMDGWGVNLFGLHDDVVRDVNKVLWLVMAVVALTLLIACANVAGLMLARIVGRDRELAVRGALGAAKGRIARHILAEAGIYALLGGGFGLLLAASSLRAIVAFGPVDIPRLAEAELDAAVLLFSFLLTLGVATLVGLLPALSAANADPARALASGNSAGGRRVAHWRRGLIIGEVALACVLAVCAGLLVHSFVRVLNADAGYTVDGLVMAGLNLPHSRYPDTRSQVHFYEQSLERLEALPEAASVAGTAEPPVLGYEMTFSFVIEGKRRPGPDDSEQAQYLRAVTPGYFRTLEIPLVRGRPFGALDRRDSPKVGIVNRAFADLHWPNSDPVGERFSLNGHEGPWIEVVGVVGDTRLTALDRTPNPAFYLPYAQKPWGWMSWMTHIVRTKPGLSLSAEAVHAAIAAIDEDIVIGPLRTVEAVYSESNARRRFAVALLSAFGLLGLVLSAIGTYGVLSYAVAQRHREFAIRMAVGGDRQSILRTVFGSGLKLTIAGLAIGIALASLLGRLLSNQLFEISALDPVTFVLVPMLILLTACLASALPAARAAGTSPSAALRHE
jgi:putative ABC transport system permease protein